MELKVNPGHPLQGVIELPGDKSISHRAALFAALAKGNSRILNFLKSGVTDAMLEILSQVGVKWHYQDASLVISGKGFSGLSTPSTVLDCRNSGTTMRLLAGALSAANLTATLDGSDGLRRRPMDRIVDPLRTMGARITSSSGGTAPLEITSRGSGSILKGLEHVLPVASAQVKTAILLAGLIADGPTRLHEPAKSRDHTERMLSAMGAILESVSSGNVHSVTMQPLQDNHLSPLDIKIPGDVSSAAFLIVGALITPGSEVLIQNVGLNHTRTGLIDVLKNMGAQITELNKHEQYNEPVGDLLVAYSNLSGVDVYGSQVTRMIDEFPAFSVAAAFASGKTRITDAEELRYKESDRITSIVAMLKTLGVQIEEVEDGFTILGNERPLGGIIQANRDHRLAMSMVICGLASKQRITVQNSEIYRESYPGFTEALTSLGADLSHD